MSVSCQNRTHATGDTPGSNRTTVEIPWRRSHASQRAAQCRQISASWPEILGFVSLRFQSIQSVRVFESGYLTSGHELLLHRGLVLVFRALTHEARNLFVALVLSRTDVDRSVHHVEPLLALGVLYLDLVDLTLAIGRLHTASK